MSNPSEAVVLSKSQAALLAAFGRAPYELADYEVKAFYRGPRQTVSGLRTRRKELEKLGLLGHQYDVQVEVRGRKRKRKAKAYGLTLKGQRLLATGSAT